MFSRVSMRFAVVLCLVSLLASLSGVAADKPVYVDGIDAAFPPFSYIDESGDPTGFDVEVIQWIAGEMGFDVEIVPVDWDAIIPTLKIGTIDMIASGMTITSERLKQVDFTDPYWSIGTWQMTKENRFPSSTFSRLSRPARPSAYSAGRPHRPGSRRTSSIKGWHSISSSTIASFSWWRTS